MMDRTKIRLLDLALPIFIENVLRTSLMSVDQFMLYQYSERAGAAMGVVNLMCFFIQLLYMMVAIGASIHISQNLGAGKKKEAGLIAAGSLALVSVFSVLLSVSIFFGTGPILSAFPLDQDVRDYAFRFLIIYGSGSFFMAINLVQGAIIRAYGYSRDPMVINIVALIFTITGNAFSLFGPFGLPVLGVTGVALSTVGSQILAMVLMAWRIRKRKAEIEIPFRSILSVPSSIYRSILSVGIPTAGENLSYNIGQIVIIHMVATIGTEALAASNIVVTLSRYIFITGISIGSATQIKVGYYVGAGKHEEAYYRVFRYFLIGFAISLGGILLFNLIKMPVIELFTTNPHTTAMISAVFLVSIALEPGRNFNTIIIPGLKGAGDVKFPVFIGMIFMWGVGVGGAYLLGIHFGLGLVGIWIALSMDEWTRGLVMLFRWKSKAWMNKSLVQAQGD